MSLENICNYSGRAGFATPLELHVEQSGGIINQIKFEYGFTTRNIEDCMTKVLFAAGTTYAEKVDFLSAPACATAYAMAIEEIANIQISQRAKVIRTLLLELNRIANHLFFIAQMANIVGLESVYYLGLREREKYCDLFELYCGSRLGFGAIQIGGVSEDASDGLLYNTEEVLRSTEGFLREINETLTNNPIFMQRLKNIGWLSQDLVLRWNLSGPNARAAMVNRDLRIDSAYAGYGAVGATPLLLEGLPSDAMGRYLYRVAEILHSKKMIQSFLTNIPSGNFKTDYNMLKLKITGDCFVQVESPRGAFGVFVLAEDAGMPKKVKFATPSSQVLRAAHKLMIGEMIEDVNVILNSLDVSVSEADL